MYSEVMLNRRQCLVLVDIEPYYGLPVPLPFVRTRLAWPWAVGSHDGITWEVKWQTWLVRRPSLSFDLRAGSSLSAACRHPPRCQKPSAPHLPALDERTS